MCTRPLRNHCTKWHWFLIGSVPAVLGNAVTLKQSFKQEIKSWKWCSRGVSVAPEVMMSRKRGRRVSLLGCVCKTAEWFADFSRFLAVNWDERALDAAPQPSAALVMYSEAEQQMSQRLHLTIESVILGFSSERAARALDWNALSQPDFLQGHDTSAVGERKSSYLSG